MAFWHARKHELSFAARRSRNRDRVRRYNVSSLGADDFFDHSSTEDPPCHDQAGRCLRRDLSGLAGVAIYIAKLREGPAPSFRVALLVAIIFVGAEAVASLLGFVILALILDCVHGFDELR